MNSTTSRVVSLIVLVAVLVAVGVLFFQVMAGFFVPLFLAVILVVMFRPVHNWCLLKCAGRKHLAAALTTAIILLAVLAPLSIVLVQAAREGTKIAKELGVALENDATPPQASDAPPVGSSLDRFVALTVEKTGLPISAEEQASLIERAKASLQSIALGVARTTGAAILGLFVMIVALFFFLLDGPAMSAGLTDLVPLDADHKQELLSRFVNVSRAIVTATLLSAVVQGLLAGVAYWIVGFESVFFLTALTMLLAMVPFVGATAVWIPCSLWLYFHDQTGAAIGLAIYGGVIVSQADNLIKPIILHGQSNLHPLLALLSVLGGVQALGPIGIVVGPMAVAFLQTLLNMLRVELLRFETKPPAPLPQQQDVG